MLWVQALVFCGGLIYAAVDDLKTRTVCDIVCIIIAAAGLITISNCVLVKRCWQWPHFTSVQVSA